MASISSSETKLGVHVFCSALFYIISISQCQHAPSTTPTRFIGPCGNYTNSSGRPEHPVRVVRKPVHVPRCRSGRKEIQAQGDDWAVMFPSAHNTTETSPWNLFLDCGPPAFSRRMGHSIGLNLATWDYWLISVLTTIRTWTMHSREASNSADKILSCPWGEIDLN